MTVLNLPTPQLVLTASAQSTQILNGTNDASGLILIAKTGNIVKIHVYCSSISGTPTISFSIETAVAVAGVRQPSGSLVNAGATLSATPGSGAWNSLTLGTPAAVTQGQMIAASVRYVSGSTSATIDRGISITSQDYGGPFLFNEDGGTYAVNVAGAPTIAVEYDDGTVVGYAMRVTDIASTWDTTTTPLKGMKWTPPVEVTVDGIWAALRPHDDFDFVAEIYTAGSGTPVAASGTLESDNVFASSGSANLCFIPLPSTTLAAGVAHRFVLRATTTQEPQAAYLMTFPTANTFAALGIVASEWAHTTNNAQDDSWTDTSNAFLMVIPRVVGVGSGGGLLGPNMRGNFQ